MYSFFYLSKAMIFVFIKCNWKYVFYENWKWASVMVKFENLLAVSKKVHCDRILSNECWFAFNSKIKIKGLLKYVHSTNEEAITKLLLDDIICNWTSD